MKLTLSPGFAVAGLADKLTDTFGLCAAAAVAAKESESQRTRTVRNFILHRF
ncbi:hypothetical protein [Brevundimonas naejangsanensis]|uniref:hypothetical protein n=1 Tax=Brevundimonas naejangsanensis TaxID=588932 RepID=UPI0026E92F5A|nr:hypothetical protein [Brevundimonas naejangsanensis]